MVTRVSHDGYFSLGSGERGLVNNVFCYPVMGDSLFRR